MFKYKLSFRSQRSKSEGFGTIYLDLRLNSDRKSRSLKIEGHQDHWQDDVQRFTNEHEKHEHFNRILSKIEAQLLKIQEAFVDSKYSFNLNDVIEAVFTKKESGEIFTLLDQIIEEFEKKGKNSTARGYVTLYNNLVTFKHGNRIPIKDVDYSFLKAFEAFLLNETKTIIQDGVKIKVKKRSSGGIHHQFRTLRATINEAIKRGQLDQDDYPFHNNYNTNGFKFSKYKSKPNSRAICESDMEKIKSFEYSDYPSLKESYLLFMFSYYARGINFIDMANLRKSDVIDGKIIYVRSKTQKPIEFVITDKLKEIISKLETHKSSYLLPIYKTPPKDIEEKERIEKNRLRLLNKDLKRISEILNLEDTFSSYAARHTYATTLLKNNVRVGIISQAMGHADVATTQAYLDTFNKTEINDTDKYL